MRKVFISLFAFVLLAFVVVAPVFAQGKDRMVLEKGRTFNGDYFAGADNVQISGTVNGDAYAGGGSILVDGTINGDLLAGGGNITISGTVNGDVRTGGGNITFSGANIKGNVTVGGGQILIDNSTSIQGSLVAGGGNIQVLAPIGRGVTIGGGTVMIANSVGGDITAGTSDLTIAQDASVSGNLNYWSENKANISDGASISGNVSQHIPEHAKDKEATKKAGAAIAGIFFTIQIVDLLWLAIIGLVLILLMPNYAERASSYVRGKFGWSLLIGLIAIIVTPIVGLILFVTLFGIPAAFVLLFLYIIIMWMARIIAVYALGRIVMERTNNKKATLAAYLVGLVVYFILSLIPIIGFITNTLVTLSGVGAMLAMKKEYYQELRKKKLL